MKPDYKYKAIVTKVYDGDTITVSMDLGAGVWLHGEKIRLAGINAPEVTGEQSLEGKISGRWLREKLLDKEVVIQTFKDKKGKYGRYIANVFLDDICINDAIVGAGLAVYKEY